MLDCLYRLKITVFPEKRRKSVDMRKANMPLSYFSFRILVRGKRRKKPAIDNDLFKNIGELITMAIYYSLLLKVLPETMSVPLRI